MKQKIEQYLSQFKTVTLIGPMTENPQTPSESGILYIDGGAKYKRESGFSIGDNDSFDGGLDLVLPPVKNYSDLAFALSLIPETVQEVVLIGFLGGRKDHELINYGEAYHFLETRSQTKIFFDSNMLGFSKGQWSISLAGTFSILSFKDQNISLGGACKYPLENQKLKAYSSHGLSNEASGIISLDLELPALVFKN